MIGIQPHELKLNWWGQCREVCGHRLGGVESLFGISLAVMSAELMKRSLAAVAEPRRSSFWKMGCEASGYFRASSRGLLA